VHVDTHGNILETRGDFPVTDSILFYSDSFCDLLISPKATEMLLFFRASNKIVTMKDADAGGVTDGAGNSNGILHAWQTVITYKR
jgi:hypothetical protein